MSLYFIHVFKNEYISMYIYMSYPFDFICKVLLYYTELYCQSRTFILLLADYMYFIKCDLHLRHHAYLP